MPHLTFHEPPEIILPPSISWEWGETRSNIKLHQGVIPLTSLQLKGCQVHASYPSLAMGQARTDNPAREMTKTMPPLPLQKGTKLTRSLPV